MSQPIYIYAFCDQPADTGELAGLSGGTLRFLEAGGVYAAISDAPRGRLRPQRRMLAAHQNVLASIAGRVSTLPCAFGLVAETQAQLETAMHEHAASIQAELARVAGCVEFDVKLAWDVPDVFDQLVELDPVLANLRSELASHGTAAPHELKVSVGRRVEAVLQAHRSEAVHAILDALSPRCREITPRDVTDEADLAHAAALLPRSEAEAFERAVEELATRFDGSHVIRIAGPFAPHSFVELRLELAAAAA
ncbi:MAG: GvpL/GvpF family gas vesicle protein [Planctomycetota bacterium]